MARDTLDLLFQQIRRAAELQDKELADLLVMLAVQIDPEATHELWERLFPFEDGQPSPWERG